MRHLFHAFRTAAQCVGWSRLVFALFSLLLVRRGEAQGEGEVNGPVQRNRATYRQTYFDDFETSVGLGLALQNGAVVVTDSSSIAGRSSVRLTKFGSVASNPVTVQIPDNMTYIVELECKILDRSPADTVLNLWMKPADEPLSNRFAVIGAGRVAIDNIRVVQAGARPWRRDFENGFVFVNPFNQPYAFSASQVAGDLHRAGIRRIRGTQAPEVNSGQAVDGGLVLAPFDAVILLADVPFHGRRRGARK